MADSLGATAAKRSESPPRRQRACLPCSKAKARCNFPQGDEFFGGACVRCRRMKIACAPQTTTALRRPRQLKPYARYSKDTPTEKRANDIPSETDSRANNVLLTVAGPPDTTTTATTNHSDTYLQNTPPPDHPAQTSFQAFGLNSYGQASQGLSEQQQQQPSSFNSPPLTLNFRDSTFPISPGFGLTWAQAEEAVSDFRCTFMPQFPYVAYGPPVTAYQLYREKAFLFRVVLLVAAPLPLATQKEIKHSVRAYIGQHLIITEERDLGILQGLLTFIAWGNVELYLDRHLTHLIYLAVGYAHNLGITRRPPSCRLKVKQAVNPEDVVEAMTGRRLTTVVEKVHTLEEMRAFLGCHYVLSANSAQFGRRSSLGADYVDHCISTLAIAAEFTTDSQLEKLSRIQQVVDRIAEAYPVFGAEHQHKSSVFLMNSECQSYREQIDKIVGINARSTPFQDEVIYSHYHYALLRRYEPAIWLAPPPINPEQEALRRTQCLAHCLQAAKSFFEVFLSTTPQQLLASPFTSMAELISVMVTTSRLILLHAAANEEDWHPDTALDFPAVLDRLAALFTEVGVLRERRVLEAGWPEEKMPSEDVWVKYAEKVRWIKMWFRGKMLRTAGGYDAAADGEGGDHYVPEPDISLTAAETSSQFWLGLFGSNTMWNFEF